MKGDGGKCGKERGETAREGWVGWKGAEEERTNPRFTPTLI